MVTRERLPCFTRFFPHVLEIAQPDYTRRDSTAFGIIRTLSRIDRIFLIYLWVRREIFTATPMSSKTWRIGPFRVITQQYVLSFKNQQIGVTRANAFPAGCPNIPLSAPFCNGFTMTTVFLLILLVRSQNSKFFFKRQGSRRSVNSHGRHLTASGRSSSSPLLLCVPTEIDILGLMRCCEAWKPSADCFDPMSFECVDFQRLSKIIANLTRENLAEREAEITNLPWTQTEKDTA